MKVHLLALGVILLASWGIAEETVILSDGSRMQVRSVEIRRNVAVIETLEGVLQSLPLAYIDVEATKALVSDEPAASALPADRDARVRWALEHYGGRELLDSYVETLTDVVEADPDAIPEKLRDELIHSFTAAFDREEIFGESTQSFLSDVDSETVDRWARWLGSPVAQKAMALAFRSGAARLCCGSRTRLWPSTRSTRCMWKLCRGWWPALRRTRRRRSVRVSALGGQMRLPKSPRRSKKHFWATFTMSTSR